MSLVEWMKHFACSHLLCDDILCQCTNPQWHIWRTVIGRLPCALRCGFGRHRTGALYRSMMHMTPKVRYLPCIYNKVLWAISDTGFILIVFVIMTRMRHIIQNNVKRVLRWQMEITKIMISFTGHVPHCGPIHLRNVLLEKNTRIHAANYIGVFMNLNCTWRVCAKLEKYV